MLFLEFCLLASLRGLKVAYPALIVKLEKGHMLEDDQLCSVHGQEKGKNDIFLYLVNVHF